MFRSDHSCFRSRGVAEFVRETSVALYSSEKGADKKGVESEVNEFPEHRRCWLGVVAVRGKGVATLEEMTTLVWAWRSMRGTHGKRVTGLGNRILIDNEVCKVQYTIYLPSTTRKA